MVLRAGVVGTLERDPAADDLLAAMLEARDTMATIVTETIEAHKESGRTVCGQGGKLRGPLARFPSAVELNAQCPLKTSGAWHTHTHQLRSPDQSLPDMANVVFRNLDASVVVGVETSDTMVAAADRDAMVERFQDALGLEVSSTREVVDALQAGLIPDPPAARRRARSRLGPLIGRASTSFPDLAGQVPARLAEPADGCPDIRLHGHDGQGENVLNRRCREEFRDRARERAEHVKAAADTEPGRIVRSMTVSMLVRRLVFGV